MVQITVPLRAVRRHPARRPIAVVLVALMLTAVVGAFPTPARAATTPIPTFTLVPTTPTSQPYGSNDAGVANLADFRYVQEEFFISGTASGGIPYTTRMLVRRPASPANFSGTVIAESSRSTATRSMWSLRAYIMRSGHASVEFGSNIAASNHLVSRS